MRLGIEFVDMLSYRTPASAHPGVFVSYSHHDERWKDRLVQHLRMLEPKGVLSVWDDLWISAGDDWRSEIEQAIERAVAAVLLLSADFLTSRFILSEEVPRILERRRREGLRVIPIIVQPCHWQNVSWLSSVQVWPRDGTPLASLHEAKAEEVLASLVVEVRDLLGPPRSPAPRPALPGGDGSQRVLKAPAITAGRDVQVTGDANVLIKVRGDGNTVQLPGSERSATSGETERDDAAYWVWFGTNRRPLSTADLSKGFSAGRDTVVRYGVCQVFVPKAHKIGSIGAPWWKRVLTGTDDRLRLMEIRGMAPAGYWTVMSEHLAQVDALEREAVVFVHGYNVSFEEAALRAAQIGFDLSVRGVMAFFSWPSQGRLRRYAADEAAVEASERAVADFLVDVAARSGARSVHVVAHSMGNRAVLRAVNRIAADAERRSGVRFGQFVLAAADVDADTFRQNCTAYRSVARGTTLYVSGRDRAVEVSEWLHGYPRAGLTPPVLVAPGIDTVNVTDVDLTALGHGYVAGARAVLEDIHSLLFNGSPPERRFGLREAQTPGGEKYWVIGA